MPEYKKLLLLGSGGHCMSVLDTLLASNEYNEIGLVDAFPVAEDNPIASMNIPVVGSDEDLQRLYQADYQYAFIAVGSIGNVGVRKKLYDLIKNIGFLIPNIIDKSSIVSDYAKLSEGVYVGKRAVINVGASAGNCAIVNTGSIVEHGCKIGDFVHVSPGAIICGDVKIGNNTHIGAGSLIKQGIQVGENSMVGMGSVVIRNIPSCCVAYGNPCKEVRYE